jgi:hypothetical protein
LSTTIHTHHDEEEQVEHQASGRHDRHRSVRVSNRLQRCAGVGKQPLVKDPQEAGQQGAAVVGLGVVAGLGTGLLVLLREREHVARLVGLEVVLEAVEADDPARAAANSNTG